MSRGLQQERDIERNPSCAFSPSHRKVRNTQREREKQTQKIKTYIFISQPPPVRRGEEWMSWEAGDLKKWKVTFSETLQKLTAINQSQRRRKKLYTSRTTYRFSSVEVAPSCPKSTPRTRKKKIPGWFSKSGEAPEALPAVFGLTSVCLCWMRLEEALIRISALWMELWWTWERRNCRA